MVGEKGHTSAYKLAFFIKSFNHLKNMFSRVVACISMLIRVSLNTVN